jgi:hypothetical protein
MAVPRGSSSGGDRTIRATRIRGERPKEPRRRNGPVALSPGERVTDPARPRAVVDYALARRSLLARLSGGDLLAPEVSEACDADPYLLRAARHHGERTERRCPVCRREDLTHVTYVFGDELGPYTGRVRSTAELPEMALEYGEFRVYVFEVCSGCGWNNLYLSYTLGDGKPRRPPPRPADLLD